jgi:hypothetical protein
MRRSQRKIVAWLVITVIGLNPSLGVLAVDDVQPPMTADCQVVMAANVEPGAADHTGAVPMTDCAQQHHACASFCQFTSLQPHDPPHMRASRLLWFALPGEPEALVTRFLDGLERPPRV